MEHALRQIVMECESLIFSDVTEEESLEYEKMCADGIPFEDSNIPRWLRNNYDPNDNE